MLSGSGIGSLGCGSGDLGVEGGVVNAMVRASLSTVVSLSLLSPPHCASKNGRERHGVIAVVAKLLVVCAQEDCDGLVEVAAKANSFCATLVADTAVSVETGFGASCPRRILVLAEAWRATLMVTVEMLADTMVIDRMLKIRKNIGWGIAN